MSVSLLPPCSALPPTSLIPRKRTSSFSFPCPTAFANPRPAKAPRISQMGALRRTETSYALELEPSTSDTGSGSTGTQQHVPVASKGDAPIIPYHRSLQYQQDQRKARRKQAAKHDKHDNLTALPTHTPRKLAPQQTMPLLGGAAPPQQSATPRATSSSASKTRSSRSRTPTPSSLKRAAPILKAPAQVILPSANSKHAVTIVTTVRTSSPLSPVRTYLPGRPVFPRSKVEPDLYKKALLSRMKQTQEGKQMVKLGPRCAISVLAATNDLAKMIEEQMKREAELDIIMGEEDEEECDSKPVGLSHAPTMLTNSWVAIDAPPATEDWVMIDCAA